MKTNSLEQISEAIHASKNVTVFSHYSPDADAYGSSCGLTLALKGLGKSVVCINESGVLERYGFIPGVREIKSELPSDFGDLVVICDCGDLQRVGDSFWNSVKQAPKIINIDHHVSNTLFGSLNYVDVKASSTAEIIYELLIEMKVKVSPKIAEALFAGIMADTGSFRYSSTTKRTFEVASKLLESGANNYRIGQELFANDSLAAIQLQSEAITNLKLYSAGKIAEVLVTKEMFEKWGAKAEDSEGLVEKARDVKGVEIACFIRWQDELWRVSLRSRDERFDVSKVALSFGGGGHKMAAAFRWRKGLEELRAEIVSKLSELISK